MSKETLNIDESKKIIWEIFEFSSYFNPSEDLGDPKLSESPISNSSIKHIINKIPFIKHLKTFYSYGIYKFRKLNGHYFTLRDMSLIKESRDYQGYPYHDEANKLEWVRIKRTIRRHWFDIHLSKFRF